MRDRELSVLDIVLDTNLLHKFENTYIWSILMNDIFYKPLGKRILQTNGLKY